MADGERRPIMSKRLPDPLLPAALQAVLGSVPILRREVFGLLRSRRCYWISFLTVLVTGLAPLAWWPAGDALLPFEAAARGFEVYHDMFVAALLIFVPAVAADGITSERREGTWDLLKASMPRPSSIAFGKLAASTLFFEVLLVLAFPVVLRLHLLGGVEIEEYFGLLLSLSLLAVVLGTYGLAFSFRCRTAGRAMAFSYAAAALPAGFLWMQAGAPESRCLLLIVLALPGLVLLRRAARQPDPPLLPAAWDRPRPAGSGPGAVRVTRPVILEEVLREASRGIPERWNPVFLAAVRMEGAGIVHLRRAAYWGSGLLTFVLTLIVAFGLGPRSIDESLDILAVLFLLPILLLVPASAALGLLAERTPGRLDLLRSTTLSAGEVLRGKLGAALLGTIPLLVWNLASSAVLILALFRLEADPGRGIIFAACSLPAQAAAAFLAASAGTFAAAAWKRVMPSLTLAYAIILAVALAFRSLAAGAEGNAIVLASLAALPALVLHRGAAALLRRSWLRE